MSAQMTEDQFHPMHIFHELFALWHNNWPGYVGKLHVATTAVSVGATVERDIQGEGDGWCSVTYTLTPELSDRFYRIVYTGTQGVGQGYPSEVKSVEFVSNDDGFVFKDADQNLVDWARSDDDLKYYMVGQMYRVIRNGLLG